MKTVRLLLEDLKLICGGALIGDIFGRLFAHADPNSWAGATIGAIFVACILPMLREIDRKYEKR